MLLIALASPLLLGPASADAGTQWAASVGIAQIEAKRRGRPMMAVYMPGGRGFWTSALLSHPEVQPSASAFVIVNVETPQEFTQLAPKVAPPPFAQFVFLDAHGTVLKRLSGFMRPIDMRQALADVWRTVDSAEPDGAPNDFAKWATVKAMRGELEEAARLLAGPARTAANDLKAEAYGAMGDEFRARGQSEKAMGPLKTAIALSGPPAQAVRWRVRHALNRARIGEREEALQDLAACINLPGLPTAERDSVQQLVDRMSNSLRVR